jgi:hypothetical protein
MTVALRVLGASAANYAYSATLRLCVSLLRILRLFAANSESLSRSYALA